MCDIAQRLWLNTGCGDGLKDRIDSLGARFLAKHLVVPLSEMGRSRGVVDWHEDSAAAPDELSSRWWQMRLAFGTDPRVKVRREVKWGCDCESSE